MGFLTSFDKVSCHATVSVVKVARSNTEGKHGAEEKSICTLFEPLPYYRVGSKCKQQAALRHIITSRGR